MGWFRKKRHEEVYASVKAPRDNGAYRDPAKAIWAGRP
jgi:hypothetical protein